jgi:threonylcarbamoyladenosine tRNA methylthiotransferase MtaB
VNIIHKLIPHACIAADVITGFPGETEEDFDDTVEFIRSLPISYLHVFTYSLRPGTKASEMDGHLSDTEKQVRSRELHRLSDLKKTEFYQSNRNAVRQVLWESDYNSGFMYGFTDNYIRCKKPKDLNAVNTIQQVRLTDTDPEGVFNVETLG